MSNYFSEILQRITPIAILKWTGVLFVVALEVIFIVALVLSMAGAFN